MVLLGSEYKILRKGERAPDFSLRATDAKTYSLADFKDKKSLLIIFMCNHCPYVIPKIKEIRKIAETYKDLAVIGINSNESENYPEDSYEKMKEYMEEWEIPNFIYLHDETQEIAKAYGAVCTPDPFLFKNEHGIFTLSYHGRLDSQHGKEQSNHEMQIIIKELLERGYVSNEEKQSMGCSIKWKS